MGTIDNAFYLKEGQAIPDEAYGVYGSFPFIDCYVRTILECREPDKDPIVIELKQYDKIDPNKKIVEEDGVTYAICLYEECGAKIPPDKASQHLREVHDIRQKTARKIDHTNKKYFKIVLEHGTKAKEGVSVKALRKGKLK